VRHYPLVLLLCAALLAGCAGPSGPGVHAGDQYVVNSPHTLFYSFGPSQSTGPDFALDRGQRLTMLSYSFGYCHIAVQGSGQTGYVATDDIILAPPIPKPSPAPSSSRHRRTGADSRPPTPEEEGRIPLPDFPESKPPPDAPSFRY
jgi:hypothetical protein